MKIEVLGCSGGCSPGCPPSCYLVDGRVAFDAGALATSLPLPRQAQVTDVVLTHAHWDHVRDLPLTMINRPGAPSLKVHAIPETIDAVYEHLMNDQVWFPAFESTSELPPLLLANPIQFGETRDIAGLDVTAYAVEHTVPAASYVVDDGSVSVVMSADTAGGGIFGHQLPQGGSPLAAVFVEASFPNRYDLFAKKTGHMTPEMLGRECEVLGDDVAVYVTHMKPGYEEELTAEVVALGRPNIQVCVQGAVLEFGG